MRRPRIIRIVLYALLGLLVLVGSVILWQVDDWSRDLTTNHSATDPDHPDPALRPIDTVAPILAAAEAVRDAAAGLPRWKLVDERADGAAVILHFVRTSALFRFADDVHVRIEDRGAVRRIAAESTSRVGKGDLGQNPRNLKELLGAVSLRLRARAEGR